MAASTDGAPPSPCTSVCQLDARGVCRGCGRLVDEIMEWPSADAERKRAIVSAARSRLNPVPQPPSPT